LNSWNSIHESLEESNLALLREEEVEQSDLAVISLALGQHHRRVFQAGMQFVLYHLCRWLAYGGSKTGSRGMGLAQIE